LPLMPQAEGVRRVEGDPEGSDGFDVWNAPIASDESL